MKLTIIDRERALNFVDGDEASLAEVVQAFNASVPAELEKVKKAVTSAAPDAICFSVHKMKSSMSIFCDGEVIAALTEIEARTLAGDIDTASANLSQLEPKLRALIAEVRTLVATGD